jgi:transposase InsO family protein
MPPTNNLLTLNNYDYSDDHLEKVKYWLLNNEIPSNDDMTTQQQYRFRKRYDTLRFKVDGDKLIFTPLGLECIPNCKRESILKDMYDDNKIGAGLGIFSFYNKVTQLYLGIKRSDVRDFLSRQTTYQLTKQKTPSINRCIIAKYPNQRWQIDLLDVANYCGFNKKRKYILTAIDIFSRYVFAIGIVNKTPKTIIKGLEEIYNKQSHVFPLILQSDNGSEFKNKDMTLWCEQNGIRQLFTPSHTPTSNGLVENWNKQLRKIMRDIFVRTNTLNWIDHLSDITHNRNNTKNTTSTKQIPAKIWSESRSPHSANSTEQKDARDKLETKAKQNAIQHNDSLLEIGDHVRVLLAAITSEVRNKIKRGLSKYISVTFSPTIHTITKVYNSRNEMQKMQYSITGYGGKKFYGNELQKVSEDTKEINLDLNKLNREPK